jgi:hypothetical protein
MLKNGTLKIIFHLDEPLSPFKTQDQRQPIPSLMLAMLQ